MAEYIPPLTTCSACSGDGFDNGSLCITCLGTGAVPVRSKSLLFLKKIYDEQAEQKDLLVDILDKCNDIFEKVNEKTSNRSLNE